MAEVQTEINTDSENISRANVIRHNNDIKIIEFMQDLKEAIENGEFQNLELPANEVGDGVSGGTEQASVGNNLKNLINVNNLSNQTFNYIINWLKQQQIDENEKDTSNRAISDSTDAKLEPNSSELTSNNTETQMLRTQVRLVENEKDKLLMKFKDLQEENIDLKTKLINLKNSSSFEVVPESGKSSGQLLAVKDYEIQRLNLIIEELLKSNDEKEKRCEDLSKQVLRFKRIQEIVLSAQTSVGFKNKIDMDFDTNSDSNSLPSINGDDILTQQALITASKLKAPTHNPNPTTAAKQQHYQTANPKVLASNITHACSLISSCSLSSSLSSSSTASSTSSNGSSAPHQMAPLATISELNNSSHEPNHRKSMNITTDQHYNTLPLQNTESKRLLTDVNDLEISKYRSLNKLNKSSSNNSSNTMVNESVNDVDANELKPFMQNLQVFKMTKKVKKQSNVNGGSVNSLNNDIIKMACQQAEKNDKYLSNCSVNRPAKPNNMKKQNSVPPLASKATSPSHNSIKSFFGKLIRTSLVNINESGFSSNTLDKKKASKQQSMADDSLQMNQSSSSFKRGGVRATANARLQHNSYSLSNSCLSQVDVNNRSNLGTNELDTLTFAKWNSCEVYDWLNKNGFEAYFPYNSEGFIGHKWIKNGLHLLQATPGDYEKELGIKNQLHRKRLGLLLQSMYNVGKFTQLEVNYMNFIDQLWVTKWLDDIGLPQYKDIFNESKIDGMMLNHLTNDDLQSMNIQSELHYLGIKRAIHVLRLNEFNPHCLRRRPSGDELLDKSEVVLWTNHRVMEWLRSIDLSEYAPNLRGSGVHGALMVFEGRFTSTVLADILAIPASKTLLRRHLSTLFIDLIGPQMYQLKRDTESQPNYQQLSASTKLKLTKRSLAVSLFSHKRTKSQDREFLTAPVLKFGEEYKPYDTFNQSSNLSGPVNAMIASFREETSAFDKEISMNRKTKNASKERTYN